MALLAGFVVLLTIASNAFIAHSISQLEREHARQHVKSALYAYDSEVSELVAQTADWANWDDTYQFMADRDQEYLTSNFPLETFQALSLNLALLLDPSGQVVFGKAYDAQSQSEAPLPPSLLQGDLLATLAKPPRSFSGLLSLPEGPLLFAAEPIRTSTRTGPFRGTLLFGRWLNDAMMSHFEGIARSEITFVRWLSQEVPADFAEAREHLSGGELEYVHTLSNKRIAAYAVLRDIQGEPALILRVINDRDIYQHALASRALFTVLLLIFAGTMGLAIVLLMIQILENGQELSDILNGSADPIVLVSADGTILKANTVFEAICGPGQRSLLDVVCPEHPEHREALQSALRNAGTLLSTQTLPEVAFRCQSVMRRAGEFEVVLSPLRTRLKRSPRLIITLHDLTPRKQMEAHLRSALNREIEINRLKTQFLSVASHEFRTPLAVIQSAADLLNFYWDRQTESERQERLLQIKNAVATMRQLTDDLLVHMRTETGALEVHPEPLDINALAQHVASEVALTQGTDVHITLRPAPTPRPVRADPNLMTLVLRNLLSNAVKYSPPDKTVLLSIAQDNGHTVLTLRDEGIGIPQEEQAHLFTPFFRASNVGRIPGTGLGLSIVKRAVELQGGNIAFESVPGQGTTFRVTLPHGVPTTPAQETQPQTVPLAGK